MIKLKPGDTIVFREKSDYCTNFILRGDIIYETNHEYVISCREYPFKWNKETIINKPKNNMLWLCTKIIK